MAGIGLFTISFEFKTSSNILRRTLGLRDWIIVLPPLYCWLKKVT